MLYPAFLKLEGLPVVVVGGGPVAASKLDGLLAAGAHLPGVAPRGGAAGRGRAHLIESEFTPPPLPCARSTGFTRERIRLAGRRRPGRSRAPDRARGRSAAPRGPGPVRRARRRRVARARADGEAILRRQARGPPFDRAGRDPALDDPR